MIEYSELHPFAYRVHTHKLGSVVAGYVIQEGKWNLLGKRDPQTPQVRYSILHLLTISGAGLRFFPVIKK